jgi:hypothetical protein
VKSASTLLPARVREAIASGVYRGGGREFPCQEEAEEATHLLLNQIKDTYQRIAGEALNWDSIILTGGGSALLYEKLIEILDHNRIILADDKESIHLANVRGGMKLWRLYEALEVL